MDNEIGHWSRLIRRLSGCGHELVDHRRANHVMNVSLRDVSEAGLASALYSNARMVDEEGQQKCRLLVNIFYDRVYARAQQSHGSYQTPAPYLIIELIVDP